MGENLVICKRIDMDSAVYIYDHMPTFAYHLKMYLLSNVIIEYTYPQAEENGIKHVLTEPSLVCIQNLYLLTCVC